MGMTKCRACKQPISKNAKVCPTCGEPRKNGLSFGRLLLISLVLFGAIMYKMATNTNDSPPQAAQLQQQSSSRYDEAMAEILKEKSVLNASWGAAKGPSLFVAIKDDGSRRDGLAQTFCLILKGHSISGVVVHVMSPQNFKNFNTEEDLGRCACK